MSVRALNVHIHVQPRAHQDRPITINSSVNKIRGRQTKIKKDNVVPNI